MSEDTNTVDIEDVSLADFEKEFFGATPANPKAEQDEPKEETEEVKEDDVDETEDNSLAPDEDDDDVEEEDEDEDSEEEEIEEVPQPKQKRNKTQERIEKLVAEARQAERERDALRAELEKRERAEKEANKEEEAPKNIREQLSPEAPNPDAVDAEGNPLYDLGEFDPKFIRDLTRFTIEQETKAAKEREEIEAQKAQLRKAQEDLTNSWAKKIEDAEAELPDLREKLASMQGTFQNIDPAYGEYLAATIMQCDAGPQIMYYLSQNIDEAQRIVASGPVAATLALGRLEARLGKEQEKKRNTKQVSKAPDPPTDRTRGKGGKFAVAPDTDDLAAFEREFFS